MSLSRCPSASWFHTELHCVKSGPTMSMPIHTDYWCICAPKKLAGRVSRESSIKKSCGYSVMNPCTSSSMWRCSASALPWKDLTNCNILTVKNHRFGIAFAYTEPTDALNG